MQLPANQWFSRKLARAGVEAVDSIGEIISDLHNPCDYRERQSLYLASTPKDVKMMEREFKTRQKHRFAVEFLQRSDVLSLFSLDASCAILNRDAADVNPVKLTLALIRSARKKGLQVFSHTRVKTYGRNGKDCVLTTEDDFQIRARHIIFATVYESQQFLKQKEVHLVSSYAIASTPRTQFPANYDCPVIWESARPYLYVRTTVDSRIVAGGEDVHFFNERKRDRLLPSKARILEGKIRKMFPHISWELDTAWTGTFGESKDGLPYIGEHKDFPGAYFALGYGGNGITFAAMASLIIPDMILGLKNSDAKLFRFDRKGG